MLDGVVTESRVKSEWRFGPLGTVCVRAGHEHGMGVVGLAIEPHNDEPIRLGMTPDRARDVAAFLLAAADTADRLHAAELKR